MAKEPQPIWKERGFNTLEEMVDAFDKKNAPPAPKEEEPRSPKTYKSDYLSHNMTFKYLNDTRIEFMRGYFTTDDPPLQRAIESTAAFKKGTIKIVEPGAPAEPSKMKMAKGVSTSQTVGNVNEEVNKP